MTEAKTTKKVVKKEAEKKPMKKVAEKVVKKEAKLADGTIAVIKTGGKQYVVSEGEIIKIEKVDAEDIKDNKISFEEVLLIDDGKATKLGDPFIKGAKVVAEVIKEVKDKKVTVIRFKSKSRYFKKRGHRQPVIFVKIASIK